MSYQKPSVKFHELPEDDSLFQAEFLLGYGMQYLDDEDEEEDSLSGVDLAVFTWRWQDVTGVGYVMGEEQEELEAAYGAVCFIMFANGNPEYIRANYKEVHTAWLKYRVRERLQQKAEHPYLQLHKN